MFCLAHFVGCNGTCLSDGVQDLDLATRLWSFLELTPTYLEGLSLSPGLPSLASARTASRELTFYQIVCVSRSVWKKLGRVRCCTCGAVRAPGQFHHGSRRSLLCSWYWVDSQGCCFQVRRGAAPEGFNWGSGILFFGHAMDSSWCSPTNITHIEAKVLHHPHVGCASCDDVFREHLCCASCKVHPCMRCVCIIGNPDEVWSGISGGSR